MRHAEAWASTRSAYSLAVASAQAGAQGAPLPYEHAAEAGEQAEGVGGGHGWFPLHPAAAELDLSGRGLQVLPGSLRFMVSLTTATHSQKSSIH